jgi:hypothetical protein
MDYSASGGPSFGGTAQCNFTCLSSGDILTGPPEAMRLDLLNCLSWQNWAGGNLANVFIVGSDVDPGEYEFPTPYIVISMLDDCMGTRIDTGPFTRGTLVLYFEDTVSTGCDVTSAYNLFSWHVGSVITELNGQGIASTLFRTGITPLQRPWRSQVEDVVAFYTASFNVRFGPQ